jgi:hypothetical protein
MQWLFGLILIVLFIAALFRDRHSWVKWILAYIWCAAVIMSISRVNIDSMHPVFSGPRYFFFPFIIQSWFLLQIALTDSNRWIRWLAWLLIGLGVFNSLPILDRKHDNLSWGTHLHSCQMYEKYSIPVHYDGNASRAWGFLMTGEKCSELLAKDLFYKPDCTRSFPYRVIGKAADGVVAGHVPSMGAVINNEWSGHDYYSVVAGTSTLPTWQVLGSFINSDTEAGELTLHLRRGDQVWFRSEHRSLKQKIIIDGYNGQYTEAIPAASEWVLLEFSNASLPKEFNVRFVDGGGGWGEWSAIALKAD